MRNTTLKSQFLKYVSLNIIGMMGISFYILADTFFISKALGTEGLAALNFCLAVFSVMQGLGLMIGIGGAARFSILKGLGKFKEASQVFMNSLYLGVMSMLIFIAAGIFFSTEISVMLGADNDTIAHTEVYMCTMLCFSPGFITNNILMAFIRNDGNPKICMISMLVSSLSNVLLDYIFIFLLDMRMYGAVFATGLSPIISMAILIIHIKSKNNTLKLCKARGSFRSMFSLMKLGVSSLITELSSAVTVIAFNLIMLKINGNTGVAAYGIVANTSLVAAAVFSGISQGIQPLASSEYGKGNRKELSELLKYSILTAIAASALIFVSVFVGAKGISSAFNSENDPVLNKIAVNGLRIYFSGYLFAGLNIVMSAFFSAVDLSPKAFVISVMRSAVLIVPAVILLSMCLGVNGVWLSFPLTELVTFIAAAVNICSSEYVGSKRASL